MPADALSKQQAKRLAEKQLKEGEESRVNKRRPNAVDFDRAAARVDWMKEPWLLLEGPPQSISSMDTVHNVMGSVYSVGVTRHGVDDLVEQYATR